MKSDAAKRLFRKALSDRSQACGSMQHLQVHHLKFRSQSGADVEQNLITLCAACHAQMHLGAFLIEGSFRKVR